ncbi:DNA mismatch repair protein MutT [Alteribacter lacisalsi]|uniref:DNA mismatch repair protein MutT n=1 Tax=Alteribacter lacisalsi TaxID=2045244 RepID=A0A2W0HGA7_9BACI|nr:NUDIX hydrolase [Alteribacter lacisalsi]PYZ96445.1 DNA mismatch repair protein MutT [Alteribacter lacisalsi]
MKRIDAVHAVILHEIEDKVLMVKNIGSGWSLPGGGVEAGETLEQAVVREAAEETGLSIAPGPLLHVNEVFFEAKNSHVLFFTFLAAHAEGTPAIVQPDEIADIQWVSFDTADRLMPYFQDGIKKMASSPSSYRFQGHYTS